MTASDSRMECDPIEGCGGGQNCIVLRRINKDPVHEDMVFGRAGIPRRACCSAEHTAAQVGALSREIAQVDSAYLLGSVAVSGPRCDPLEGCGHGQNCIVLRRINKDPVHEDMVFRRAGIALRACCSADHTAEQARLLDEEIAQVDGALLLGAAGAAQVYEKGSAGDRRAY